jgi:hypothetical protein
MENITESPIPLCCFNKIFILYNMKNYWINRRIKILKIVARYFLEKLGNDWERIVDRDLDLQNEFESCCRFLMDNPDAIQ